MRRIGRSVLTVIAVSWLALGSAAAQQGATHGEWRSYGGDTGSTKYSPLDQITAENFSDLEVAWHWKTEDTHLTISTDTGSSLVQADVLFDLLDQAEPDLWVTRPRISRLIATPLMADGVLYLSTPLYRAVAIDARAGETLWVYDPRAYESGTPAEVPWSHGVGSARTTFVPGSTSGTSTPSRRAPMNMAPTRGSTRRGATRATRTSGR